MVSLIPSLATQSALEAAIDNVFDTFKRPFTIYIEAQKAYISTNPNTSRFGQQDQNVFNPPVTPQATVVYGCILYGPKQDYAFIEPATRSNYDQEKLRNQFGTVRLKLDSAGYALMQQAKLVQLDGFEFKITSSARPRGLFVPSHWTFLLDKVD